MRLGRGDGGDRGLGAGVRGEAGEGRLLAGGLDVVERLAGGEVRDVGGGGLGHGDDLGAVGERADVVAEDGHLGHGLLEALHHELLVVDERLPLARRAGVTEGMSE